MTSRFVSGGTNEEPTERDEAWLSAQKEIDAKRLEQKLKPGEQEGGKSLYETLQANKGDFLPLLTHYSHRHTPLTRQELEPRNKTPLKNPSAYGISFAASMKTKSSF
jgi:hypothetical protein